MAKKISANRRELLRVDANDSAVGKGDVHSVSNARESSRQRASKRGRVKLEHRSVLGKLNTPKCRSLIESHDFARRNRELGIFH